MKNFELATSFPNVPICYTDALTLKQHQDSTCIWQTDLPSQPD
jgi:hypothetical protein